MADVSAEDQRMPAVRPSYIVHNLKGFALIQSDAIVAAHSNQFVAPYIRKTFLGRGPGLAVGLHKAVDADGSSGEIGTRIGGKQLLVLEIDAQAKFIDERGRGDVNILQAGVENRQSRIIVEVGIALGDHIGSIGVHEMNSKRVVRVQMVVEAPDELVGDLGASREKGVVE